MHLKRGGYHDIFMTIPSPQSLTRTKDYDQHCAIACCECQPFLNTGLYSQETKDRKDVRKGKDDKHLVSITALSLAKDVDRRKGERRCQDQKTQSTSAVDADEFVAGLDPLLLGTQDEPQQSMLEVSTA